MRRTPRARPRARRSGARARARRKSSAAVSSDARVDVAFARREAGFPFVERRRARLEGRLALARGGLARVRLALAPREPRGGFAPLEVRELGLELADDALAAPRGARRARRSPPGPWTPRSPQPPPRPPPRGRTRGAPRSRRPRPRARPPPRPRARRDEPRARSPPPRAGPCAPRRLSRRPTFSEASGRDRGRRQRHRSRRRGGRSPRPKRRSPRAARRARPRATTWTRARVAPRACAPRRRFEFGDHDPKTMAANLKSSRRNFFFSAAATQCLLSFRKSPGAPLRAATSRRAFRTRRGSP